MLTKGKINILKKKLTSEDEAYLKMNESAQSLLFLLSNGYEKLKQAGKLGWI